jgi:hypothetical protein
MLREILADILCVVLLFGLAWAVMVLGYGWLG